MNAVPLRQIVIEIARNVLTELAEKFGEFIFSLSSIYSFITTLIEKFIQGYKNAISPSYV